MLRDGHQGRIQRRKQWVQRGEGGITDTALSASRYWEPGLFVVLALHVTEIGGIGFGSTYMFC